MSAKKRRTGALPKRSPQRGPDGCIIERNGQIRKLRQTIRAQYGVTLLVVIYILIWSFAIAVYQWQSPERWTRAEIVYSHLSRESIGIRRGLSYVLHSADGRKFVVQNRDDFSKLNETLRPGKSYSLVYSKTIAGGDMLEELSDGAEALLPLEKSIAHWEAQRRQTVVSLYVTCGIEIAALILIDRLWCKKEYAQIRAQKEMIRRRQERMEEKSSKGAAESCDSAAP